MKHTVLLALAIAIAFSDVAAAPAVAQQKDYLTRLEADKVRDAEDSTTRIKLFVGFAADRIRKIQYELARPNPDRRRTERLNDLLNQYAGCVDDAAELVVLGLEKTEDIRAGAKELNTKGKEFLEYLEKLSTGPQDVSAVRDNLDDAITATKDALKDAEKAMKEISPGPVRRKQ